MAIVKCPSNHFYDSVRFPDGCPHCRRGIAPKEVETDYIYNKKDDAVEESNVTVGYFMKNGKSNPVTGWLVGVIGENRGKSFEIRSGKNFVGRSMDMDIVLNDSKISRSNHISIVFEPNECLFFAVEGNNLCYVNGSILKDSIQLNENDELRLGESEYLFIPYCRKGREWDE